MSLKFPASLDSMQNCLTTGRHQTLSTVFMNPENPGEISYYCICVIRAKKTLAGVGIARVHLDLNVIVPHSRSLSPLFFFLLLLSRERSNRSRQSQSAANRRTVHCPFFSAGVLLSDSPFKWTHACTARAPTKEKKKKKTKACLSVRMFYCCCARILTTLRMP